MHAKVQFRKTGFFSSVAFINGVPNYNMHYLSHFEGEFRYVYRYLLLQILKNDLKTNDLETFKIENNTAIYTKI
jgi:hypothetical protein